MARLRNTLKVSVQPAIAWRVVGDLGAVDRWVPGVTSCQLEGSRRICNQGEIEEEISSYSEVSKSFRYRHVKLPLPVRSSSGRLAVQTDVGGAQIVWDAEIEVLDPSQEAETLAMIDGYYKQALDSLRTVIEADDR